MADPPDFPITAQQLEQQANAVAGGGPSECLRGNGVQYNVRVAVRCRPLLPKESSERCRECVRVCHEDKSIYVGKACFAFDHVFGTGVSQERVHEEVARPLLESLGSGLNATLLAYGQTSSGKTYTMGSCNSTSMPEEQHGIIPRFVNGLFRDIIYPRLSEAEILIRATFVELHNEDVNDLLEPNFVDKAKSISVRDDPQQGVVITGIKHIDVKRPSELLRCLEKGAIFRTTASTNMNEQSSRSHAIFTVSVEQQNHSTGNTLLSKVRFADLAGSERAKKTGCVGERFREGVNINQGLLALGNVISALGDPKLNRSHVPYRDSKLTRLLQDSLGGNSRTLMVACISPADVHFSETLNTLKYANRAKNIRNKVTVNVSAKSTEVSRLKEQIQEMHTELARFRQAQGLRGDLNEKCLPAQEVERLQSELRSAQQGLREATEEALLYRAKYERRASMLAGGVGAAGEEGKNTDMAEETLLRYLTEIKELRERNAFLESRLQWALAGTGAGGEEDGDMPDSGTERTGLTADCSPARVIQRVDAVNTPGSPEVPTHDEEALAHVAEDAREEEQFRNAQSEMRTAVLEFDDVIREKEQLMEQLTKQSKVFRSMQARYELRLKELQEAVGHATGEKEQVVKEMQQLMGNKQNPRDEGEVAKRKAQLQGQLHEVNRQLVDLKQRQREAQRLLRLKEQQAVQIRRMQEEIDRLKGQKLVVLSRMKCEEQQHRLWRQRCDQRLRELTRKGAELQRLHRQQGKLLGKKTKEADVSARKVRELRREQQQLLDASRRRSQIQIESRRARRLREVNERLQRELEEREMKVRQMESILARRRKLQDGGAEAGRELEEVDDSIELLDAQIDFTTECIAQSQTDILRLTIASPEPEAEEGCVESSDAPPPEAVEEVKAAHTGMDTVAGLKTLEDAKATCLACFTSLDEAQCESARLQARVAELEAELAQRASQVEELHARQRFAERQWAEQASELQRLHMNKEVYLLSQVDRTLTEEHGLSAPAQPGVVQPESPTPAEESLTKLLECRTQQIELLQQHVEELQRDLAAAESARSEAETAAAAARVVAENALQAPAATATRSSDKSSGLAMGTETAGVDPAKAAPAQLPSPCTVELQALVAAEADFNVLQGVAKRSCELLGGLWRDLGVDREAQGKRLLTLAQATVQVCADELHACESSLQQLKREHDGIRQLALANSIALPPELSSGGATVDGEQDGMPLHERHAALERVAAGHLEACREHLRMDLAALYGLEAEHFEVLPERLVALASAGAQCLLGGGEAATKGALQPQDLEVLGLGDPRAAAWLQKPSIATFAFLQERQTQASALLSKLRNTLQQVDEELKKHYEVLATPEREQQDFFSQRGVGLPALLASQQELQQLQLSVRSQIAQSRVCLMEQWMELGTPESTQERILQALHESAALERLQALRAELRHAEGQVRQRQVILEQQKTLLALEDQIQEFERDASNSARLRGSSVKLLQEEQLRLKFRKKKARLVEELIAHVGQWEAAYGERFIHNGVAIRDMLQHDLDDIRELGGLTLAIDLISARKSSRGHESKTPGVPAAAQVGSTSPSAASVASATPSARRALPAEQRRRCHPELHPQ